MQNNAPKISVIIPSYNMAGYLATAVTSVIENGLEEVEVIVVDDGSSDDTPTVMKRLQSADSAAHDTRVRYLRKPNGGKASAVNRGMKEARGAFVALLDADDELTPSSLADRYKAGTRRRRSELVIGGHELFGEDGNLARRRSPPVSSSVSAIKRAFWTSYKVPFHLNACLIAKDLVERTDPMDERLRRCQDIDYSMRLLQNTDSITRVDEVVFRYRKHRNSIRHRLRLRLQTARYRPLVFWKNCRRGVRVAAVAMGLALDAAKAVYELIFKLHR